MGIVKHLLQTFSSKKISLFANFWKIRKDRKDNSIKFELFKNKLFTIFFPQKQAMM